MRAWALAGRRDTMSGKMTGVLMGEEKAGSCSNHLEDGDLRQKVTTGPSVERSARFPLACWVSRQGRPIAGGYRKGGPRA